MHIAFGPCQSFFSRFLHLFMLVILNDIDIRAILTIKSSGLVIFLLKVRRSCSVLKGPSFVNVIFHSLKNRSMSWCFIALRYSRNTSLASVSNSTKKNSFYSFKTTNGDIIFSKWLKFSVESNSRIRSRWLESRLN